MSTPKVYVDESPAAVAADTAEMFVRLSQQAASAGAPFRVALSGGSTPRLLYGLLASETFRGDVPWNAIQFFFGDERFVPHTSKDSNYKLANDELFTRLNIKSDSVFPIPTEGISPDEAADQYQATLRQVFRTQDGEVPRFDLIFLGMGDEGHTASLFPHTAVLHEKERLADATYVEKLAADRITLTPVVLNAAAEIILMVTGEGKAQALEQVLEGEYNPDEYPSQLLRNAQGTVTWQVDRAAAAQLKDHYVER
ncbi:MAG: 6-phosphogluconolactonase [Chloroflexi bacterium]|nr:6-phosphogluconolactonase [Chloroflexota bacterium]